MILSTIGLITALLLLIGLTLRGVNLFIVTPFCGVILALSSNIPILAIPNSDGRDLVTFYMDGFSGFIADWFLIFLLGSLFGKLMEYSGAADSVARWVMNRVGPSNAAYAVVFACAILTYGGVSLFVVAFSVYPIALVSFRAADLPRRYIPAALAFGSVTFTMTSAGSPEIQNWIPIQYLNTSPWAAWQASVIVAAFMAGMGTLWLNRMLAGARARGEHFEPRNSDPEESRKNLPTLWRAIMPSATILGCSFLFHGSLGTSALIVALFAGNLVLILNCWRHLSKIEEAVSLGSVGALVAIGNTAAVVGFGAVAKNTSGFLYVVEWLTQTEMGGVAGAAITVSMIAAITGSASGGQAIALPLIAPDYVASGVNPDQLHRAVAISSGALDTLPHNGYVVTTIKAVCKETHQAAYGPLGALTVVVPLFGLGLCLFLFSIGL